MLLKSEGKKGRELIFLIIVTVTVVEKKKQKNYFQVLV